MSTLHDDALSAALKDAARKYPVPPGGTARILVAASAATQRPDPARGAEARRWNRRRLALVAAVAIVLAVLAGSLSLAGLGMHASHNAPTLAAPTAGQRSEGFTSAGIVATGLKQLSNGLSALSGSNSSTQPGSTPSNPQVPMADQTKVVSVGSVSLSVPVGNFNRVLAKLSVLATSVAGYVSSSKVTAGSQAGAGGSSGVIELRIPQKKFDSVVAKAEHLGRVVSAVTNSTDVTSEYVDYESRIGALDASRAQYLAIMAKASSIGDILAIQAQVNVIESEIEQLEGQRNLLVNQAAYGTLTIAINQGAAAPSHPSGVHRAWNQSISGFVSGVEWLIRAAGPALFALLCLAALLLLGRLSWRASQRRLI
jgi:hypothetical protein